MFRLFFTIVLKSVLHHKGWRHFPHMHSLSEYLFLVFLEDPQPGGQQFIYLLLSAVLPFESAAA